MLDFVVGDGRGRGEKKLRKYLPMVEQGNDARSMRRRPSQPVGEKLPEFFACQACPTPADAWPVLPGNAGMGYVVYVPRYLRALQLLALSPCSKNPLRERTGSLSSQQEAKELIARRPD